MVQQSVVRLVALLVLPSVQMTVLMTADYSVFGLGIPSDAALAVLLEVRSVCLWVDGSAAHSAAHSASSSATVRA